MRKYLILLLCMLLYSCTQEPNNGNTITTPPTPSFAGNTSVLFIPNASGSVDFSTNDTQYNSNNGCHLWCVLENKQPEFKSWDVNCTKFSGKNSAGYGVILGYRDDEFFGKTMLQILINSQKAYTIMEIVENTVTYIVPWNESAFLNEGYNQRNVLRITYNSTQREYQLFINSELETSFRDDTAPFHTYGQQGYVVVISPQENFPAIPVEVRFEEL
jgi:hypothetical protein